MISAALVLLLAAPPAEPPEARPPAAAPGPVEPGAPPAPKDSEEEPEAVAPTTGGPKAESIDALRAQLDEFEAQDPRRRISDELGTLRAWIDALHMSKGVEAARTLARVQAQARLVEALLARNAVLRQLEPVLEETELARAEAEALRSELPAIEAQLREATQRARPWLRRRR